MLTETNTTEGMLCFKFGTPRTKSISSLWSNDNTNSPRSNARYLVTNKPNLFLRYEKLLKNYQEPNGSLTEISNPPTINAPITLLLPGYPRSSLEKKFVIFRRPESV